MLVLYGFEMHFDDVIDDIEQLLVGKELQSINPKTPPIYISHIDKDAEKYFISSIPNTKGTSRSFNELRDIWVELSRKGFSNVDQALYGSGSSRNQPETVFANLPYIQHFKYKKKKHILLRSQNVHDAATLNELQGSEFRVIRQKIDNYFDLSNSALVNKTSLVHNTLSNSLDAMIKKYPGDLLVKETELALNVLKEQIELIKDAVVTIDVKSVFNNIELDNNVQENNTLSLPFIDMLDDEASTGISNEIPPINDNQKDNDEIVVMPTGKARIRQTTPVLSLIFDRLNFNEIELQPDFQRKDRIWSIVQKSKLIESILMDLPIPVFYFGEKTNGDWVVVDGLQRITSVFDFMSGGFELTGLDVLPEYNGLSFKTVARPLQRKIREYQITANLIDIESDQDNIIVELFHRINTYGVRLSSQEIRSALHQGTSVGFLRFLAGSKEFKSATNYKVKPDRQKDMELCLSAVSFICFGYKKFDNSYDSYLSETMNYLNTKKLSFINKDDIDVGESVINNNSDYLFIKLWEMIKNAFDFSSEIFGEYNFKKEETRNSPISKPLFELIICCFSYLDEQQKNKIRENSNELINMLYSAIHEDSEEFSTWQSETYLNNNRGFSYALSTSTGKTVTVKYRFEAFKEILKRSSGVEIQLIPLKELV